MLHRLNLLLILAYGWKETPRSWTILDVTLRFNPLGYLQILLEPSYVSIVGIHINFVLLGVSFMLRFWAGQYKLRN